MDKHTAKPLLLLNTTRASTLITEAYIQDAYNPFKCWVVRHYKKCGHFTINQKITGVLVNSSFQRVSLAQLQSLSLSEHIL